MKAVIFDFNGTMVFDAPYHDKAWKQFVLTMSKRELQDQELNEHFHGNVNEKIISYLFPDMDEEANKRLSLEKERVYRELCRADKKHYALVRGLPSLLDRWKEKGIPMNIASASIQENIAFFVEMFHLEKWFDVAGIMYDNGTYVDKVQMFQDAAKQLKVEIEDCLIFEDSLSGIRCAQKAGAKNIIAIAPKEQQDRFREVEGLLFVIEDYTDDRLCDVI